MDHWDPSRGLDKRRRLLEAPSDAKSGPSLHPQLLDQERVPSRSPALSFPGRAPISAVVLYRAECLLGKGSFGSVYKAQVVGSDQVVAIKTVRLHEASREVQALSILRGSPNVITLLATFRGAQNAEVPSLNIVMEFVSDTLHRILKHYRSLGKIMELRHVRLYMYQLLRGLASLARRGIVHRDIKPANLLVDPGSLGLKVCDFGSAKLLRHGEASQTDSQPYMCSRYYRAPELILSTMDTTTAVDLWSAGCVLGELLISQPLFAGTDGVHQLSVIMEILGTPTPRELYAMNPQFEPSVGFGAPIEALPWTKVVGRHIAPDVQDLLSSLLRYEPASRLQPMAAMALQFFDELRQNAPQLDPALFTFSQEEFADSSCGPAVRDKLIQTHR